MHAARKPQRQPVELDEDEIPTEHDWEPRGGAVHEAVLEDGLIEIDQWTPLPPLRQPERKKG